jgi:segregation and condensation protein B
VGKSLKLIVEALLFASDRPLSVKDIRSWLPDVEPANIRSALKVLTYEYEAMGRSFGLREVAGGFQFRSQSEYGSYILRMLQTTPARLSRAALETLAIVAYKQPIVRHEIERIRGVDSGGILRALLEKGLIRIMGRKDLPGRPLIYGTTRRFLEVFDLESLDSLPKLKEIKALGNEDHGTQTQPFPQNVLSTEVFQNKGQEDGKTEPPSGPAREDSEDNAPDEDKAGRTGEDSEPPSPEPARTSEDQ